MTTFGVAAAPIRTYPHSPDAIRPLHNSWLGRTVTFLAEWDARLETILPNFWFQDRIDEWGRLLDAQLTAFVPLADWLTENSGRDWFEQMALFLCTLPAVVADRIVRSLYGVIKELLRFGAHPLKGLIAAAHCMVDLLDAFTEVRRWPEAGAGLIGSSIGQAFGAARPLSMIRFIIGGALLVSGLTLLQLEATLASFEGGEEAYALLFREASLIPSALSSGFASGCCYGFIASGRANAALCILGL